MTPLQDLYGNVQGLLGPHVWGCSRVDVVQVIGRGGQRLELAVRAMLRPQGEPQTPREVRQRLMDAANDAIDAVEAAGYRHLRAPEVSVHGSMLPVGDGSCDEVVVTEADLKLVLEVPEERR